MSAPIPQRPPCLGCIALSTGRGSDTRRAALLAILAAAVRVTVEMPNGCTIHYDSCRRHRAPTPPTCASSRSDFGPLRGAYAIDPRSPRTSEASERVGATMPGHDYASGIR